MFPFITFFDVKVSVYFLFLSLVFTLIVPAIVYRANKLKLSSLFALDLYIFVLLGSFLGARLFYVLYQEPGFYFSNPEQIIYFWNGGYVFFGGFLGAVGAGALFCLNKKESMQRWLNFSMMLLSLGYSIGRLACFLSGCCYGAETQVSWAVFMHGAMRHPTQLYASLSEFFIFLILILIEKKKGFEAYFVLPIWLILHGLGRMFMEYYRDDPRGGEIFGLSVSTFISLVLLTLGAALLFKKLTKKS